LIKPLLLGEEGFYVPDRDAGMEGNWRVVVTARAEFVTTIVIVGTD